MKSTLGRFFSDTARDESGAIAVMAVLVMAVFLAFVGAAVDYGVFLIQKANLQNAVDAASLAGSRQLVSGATPGQAAAAATATTYLGYYGYQADAQTNITFSYSRATPGGATNEMQISVTRTLPTYFLNLVGLSSFNVGSTAQAEATPSMSDIALTLDLTGSMELTNTNDLAHLQNAVTEFINDVNPNSANAQGPQVAVAQWAGIKCGWDRNTDPRTNETQVNLGPNTWKGNGTSEYVNPCSDDKTLLTKLTMDKTALLNLAAGTQPVACGTGMSNCYALQSWNYQAKDIHSSHMASGLMYNGSSYGSGLNPTYTGTKLPNALSVFYDPGGSGFNIWSTANGGRNTGSATGNAHKILVMITDGNDELWPDQGMPSEDTVSAWDTEVVNRANALKLGPDGVTGTPDDVEVYVVGFYCTPYSSSPSNGTSPNWCTSKMADASPHPCPGGWDVTKASSIDTLLYTISSSSPGTCDHYFPIKKTEDLPALFKQLAGEIARGKLIQ